MFKEAKGIMNWLGECAKVLGIFLFARVLLQKCGGVLKEFFELRMFIDCSWLLVKMRLLNGVHHWGYQLFSPIVSLDGSWYDALEDSTKFIFLSFFNGGVLTFSAHIKRVSYREEKKIRGGGFSCLTTLCELSVVCYQLQHHTLRILNCKHTLLQSHTF